MKTLECLVLLCLSGAGPGLSQQPERPPSELLFLENDHLKIGIDKAMGASISWLSWKGHPTNVVNIHDPGRLIQQSYYAGKSLDRREDGQHPSWSPWTWNPIQGGGVGSWAKVVRFDKQDGTLHSETIPKLWDMPNEQAEAVMHQWTSFEPGQASAVMVRNRIVCKRSPDDRWGPPVKRHQEVPAFYFIRSFRHFRSYLGGGEWRDEHQEPGPPWGKANPPRKAMACFNDEGQGIAVFSPGSQRIWNFGPHGKGISTDPEGGPCVHIAPLVTVALGPTSSMEYRYWILVGSASELADGLDRLWKKYESETIKVEP